MRRASIKAWPCSEIAQAVNAMQMTASRPSMIRPSGASTVVTPNDSGIGVAKAVQFNNANTNKTNAFNRLLQTATVGTDASKALAGNATAAGNAALGNPATVGNSLGNYAVGAGNAEAAADLAIGKQVGNMFSGVTGAGAGNRLLSPGGMYGAG